MPWAVVEFLGSEEVAAVPQKWINFSESENGVCVSCWWPSLKAHKLSDLVSKEVEISGLEGSTNYPVRVLGEDYDWKQQVTISLAQIQLKLGKVCEMLETSLVGHINSDDVEDEKLPEKPLSTYQELQVFERDLLTKTTYDHVVKEISRLGGTSTKEVTKPLLRRLMSDELAQNFTFHGFKEKQVFSNLKTKSVIFDAVRKNSATANSTDADINGVIKGWLRQAKFRALTKSKSLLVAACEKRSILMFDPLSQKLIQAVDDAHSYCVNCVRFLDSRVFATGSDDNTVALWDARNLNSRVRTLKGHSNWVKSIEFSQRDDLLVTSGFDGSIMTWDINSYKEHPCKEVFHTYGLMRTRLNPDGSKMIIGTTGGYLILIHNLDLKTLREDLQGFQPNMYRMMQLTQDTIPAAASFTHLFSHKRKTNRIEFVTDFPGDAEVVSSLQVHPQGWCALSRSISQDQKSEWTCIHDIQETDSIEVVEEDPDSGGGADDPDEEPQSPLEGMFLNGSNSHVGEPQAVPDQQDSNTDVWEALVTIRATRSRPGRRVGRNGNLMDPHRRFRIVEMSSGFELADAVRTQPIDTDNEPEVLEEINPRAVGGSGASAAPPVREGEGSPLPHQPPPPDEAQPGTSASFRTIANPANPLQPGFTSSIKVPKNHKIHENIPRLSHYIEELTAGRKFIKEVCFSSDGRLIFSPYGFAVRLLAFSPECSELSTCVPKDRAVLLYDLGTNVCHSDIVVSTKFSPRHCLLVSGCLSGRIVWHQPWV